MENVKHATHVVELVTDHLATSVLAVMLAQLSTMRPIDIVDVTMDTWISALVSVPIAVQQESLLMPTDIVQHHLMILLSPSTSLNKPNFQTW
jgi:hypothetical protein